MQKSTLIIPSLVVDVNVSDSSMVTYALNDGSTALELEFEERGRWTVKSLDAFVV